MSGDAFNMFWLSFQYKLIYDVSCLFFCLSCYIYQGIHTMFEKCGYLLKTKILQFGSGMLLVAKILNSCAYKAFSGEEKNSEKTLLDLEKLMLAAGLDVMLCDSATFLIFESSDSSVEKIHVQITELASAMFLEYVSFTIGYHSFSSEAPDEVIKKAFAAVSFGEREGKAVIDYRECVSQIAEFSDSIGKATALYDALRGSELSHVFQPIVDTENSDILFSEFLLRIRGKESIKEYIVAAEKTNLISMVDRFVFKQVVELLECNSHLKLSFNLSMLSVSNDAYIHEFLQSFTTLQFVAKRMVVEITEGLLFYDMDELSDLIFKLKSFGCSIALDDFGRDFYIPFSQLQKLPIDYLKLDREFAREIESNRNSVVFLKSIVEIANNLGIKVIAEFVEDKRVFDLFKELGIRYMQGNYLCETSVHMKDAVDP